LCSSAEWDEHWDEESVDEYMDVLTTATVLEQIHSDFAGMNKINYLLYLVFLNKLYANKLSYIFNVYIATHISLVLSYVVSFTGLPSARSFPKILHEGEPNLLIVAPGNFFLLIFSHM